MPISPELQQAIDAAKAGDRVTARRILKQVLREDQNNETAWFLYAQVTDKPEHAVSSLKKVLEINPYNERARKMLDQMTPKEAPKPDPNAPWDYDRFIEKQAQAQGGKKPVKKNSQNNRYIAIGAVVVLFFLLCLGGFFATGKLLAPTPTPFPTRVPGTPTATPDTCNCQSAQEYMQRTLDRFNDLISDMETVGQGLQSGAIQPDATQAFDTKAKARLKDQRAEAPPPCLDGFNKETIQMFWNWQQALVSLQNGGATAGDTTAVLAFINNLVDQSSQMDDQVGKVQQRIPGCTLPSPATPTP
jgi:hypothetical protein